MSRDLGQQPEQSEESAVFSVLLEGETGGGF